MGTYQEDTYGERIADVYDEWYGQADPAAIRTLKELAGVGRALELGIGTGRIALPLLKDGVTIHGIDASAAMIAKLRAKVEAQELPETMGNFADVAVEGLYDLIFVLFNTFFALLTQEEQLRCMRNVRDHLTAAGRFAIECFVPDVTRFVGHQTLRVVGMRDNELRIDASQHDPVAQQVTSQHVVLTEHGIRSYPVKLRYAWPAELDLMARLAGLRLAHRWASWQKTPFSADSGKHVSIYEPIP